MAISARTRILGWMLMLVALAVGLSIVVGRSLLIAQLDDRLDRELAQEVSKFRTFASEYAGPADVDTLMRNYLREKVPDHHETFFSIVDGEAARRVAASSPAQLDTDTALDVRAALARLPEEQRVALILVDIEGYPVSEVAAILRVAEGTVKSRCARGRARLATLLGHLRNPAPDRAVPFQTGTGASSEEAG